MRSHMRVRTIDGFDKYLIKSMVRVMVRCVVSVPQRGMVARIRERHIRRVFREWNYELGGWSGWRRLRGLLRQEHQVYVK